MTAEVGSKDLRSHEQLGPWERIADLIFPIVGTLFILGFFLAHQLAHSGFLTDEFGGREMLALYGPMLLAVIPPLARASTGERNPGRLFEVIANVGLVIGALWLFFVFPFDFSHLPDVLPEAIRFMFAWITDGIARMVLILQIVIGALTAIGKLAKFIAVEIE